MIEARSRALQKSAARSELSAGDRLGGCGLTLPVKDASASDPAALPSPVAACASMTCAAPTTGAARERASAARLYCRAAVKTEARVRKAFSLARHEARRFVSIFHRGRVARRGALAPQSKGSIPLWRLSEEFAAAYWSARSPRRRSRDRCAACGAPSRAGRAKLMHTGASRSILLRDVGDLRVEFALALDAHGTSPGAPRE